MKVMEKKTAVAKEMELGLQHQIHILLIIVIKAESES